jgi:3-oxoadipate enol-lactonase
VIRTIPGTSTIQVQFYDPNGVMVEVNFSDEAYLGPSDPIAIEAHLRLADMALGRSRRSGLLKANGVETAYEMAGSGPFLVLIHGMNADRRSFQSVIPALAKHFTCVTYDQRDTGDTKNSSASYRAADLADDCAALIDHIGSPAHVWGTSFGGMIAQELALAYPQCLDRLILSVTFQDGAKIIGDAETQEMQSRSQTDPTVRAELAERFFSAKTVKSSPDLILNSQKIMVRREPDAQARRIEAMRAYNSVGRAAGISAHTLVLGAMDDRVIPPETSWALAREIPNATLTMVDGLGHALYIEDPARVGHVIAEYALRAGRSA